MTNNRLITADVVVCGAGTAGAVAAIAAADQGRDVLLIEQSGSAGGSASLGLVTPMMHTGIAGNPMCSYLSLEINRRMTEIGAAAGDGSAFDPTMLPFVLEQMLLERKVHVMLHTTIIGAKRDHRRVTELEVFSKSGRATVSGAMIIDATGDGDVCELAGLNMLHGNEEDGKNQPVSLRYIVGGVDKAAFCEYLNKYYKNALQPESVSGAVTRGDGRTWPLDPVFDAAIEAGEIVYEDAIYWQFFSIPGRKDCIAFNCPEFFDIHDADDGDSLTEVQLQGKQAILRQLLFYRRHFGGFEGAYIASVAQFVGVRESRRAVTEHVITAEELLTHAKFDDAICQSNYPVDVHGRKLRCETIRPAAPDEPPFYEVPLRVLIVRDVDNLLVAGRNLGAEFVAQSSIRIIPTCRAMGEAAGIAAAFACGRSDKNAHSISGRDVRAEMLRRGAQFADRPGLK